ncbi:MAG: transporter substrate-binding protein [Microbacteriaceae bacterium]|jgi:peptide/nickel transport system substrate-binding protein|nr:transporter substrate-binding protein [Microbacteriaceae bacterium]
MPIVHKRSLAIAATVVAVSLALVGCSTSKPAPTSSASTPVSGGSITVGGFVAGGLDPGQVSFSSQSLGFAAPIFGSLFLEPTKTGGKYLPNLASGYKYTNGGLDLTVTLRKGLTFSDGTPLDATALAWNLNRHILNGTREKQFDIDVTSIKPVSGSDVSVDITFSQPQSLLLDAMATSSTGFMASPTAFAKLGANAFNNAPVGAGPFEIVSDNNGQQLVLKKNPSYYDAKHVYLDGLTYLNTGTDAQSALVALQGGSIQAVDWPGTYTSPAVLAGAKTAGFPLVVGPNLRVLILPINTYQAPFNTLAARQAISYCIDRETIAKSVTQGYTTPAFVLSGSESTALSSWQEGKKLNPLQYSVSKSKALVKQLGGLSFTITTSIQSPVLTALQQEWAACGITATINITPAYLADIQAGNYQMSFTVNVNASTNPAASTNYLDPTSANNKFGWADPSISALVTQAKTTPDITASTKLWHQIWTGLTTQGYIVPVVSAGDYVATSPKLHGVQNLHNFGDFTNAWLSK